jgi:hypothetical protein
MSHHLSKTKAKAQCDVAFCGAPVVPTTTAMVVSETLEESTNCSQ